MEDGRGDGLFAFDVPSCSAFLNTSPGSNSKQKLTVKSHWAVNQGAQEFFHCARKICGRRRWESGGAAGDSSQRRARGKSPSHFSALVWETNSRFREKNCFLFFLVRSKFGLCRIIYSNINSLLVQFLSGFSRYHFPQNIQYEFNSPPLSHNLQRVLGAAQLTFWPRSLHSSLSSAALTDVSFESVLWCPEALSFVNLISRHLVQTAAFARPKLTFLHYS